MKKQEKDYIEDGLSDLEFEQVVDLSSYDEKTKIEAINCTIQAVEKKYGQGIVIEMGKVKNAHTVDVFSTGSELLNNVLGIGGYPRGRLIEIYGSDSSGRTTLALQAIAEIQKNNGRALFIDVEHALDMNYAKILGINEDLLYLTQPDYEEQALDVLDLMIRSGAFELVVVDSVAALVPKNELLGEIGKQHEGLQAKIMSQTLRKITSVASKTRTSIIFINQIRQKTGIQLGCFAAKTPVVFADGSSRYIKDVVKNKLTGPVLSLDLLTGLIVPKRIVNWFNNGPMQNDSKWIIVHGIRIEEPKTKINFTCTPNHIIYCMDKNGKRYTKKAVELKEEDFLVSWIKPMIAKGKNIGNIFYKDERLCLSPVKILSVKEAVDKQYVLADRYDLEIEEMHNYFVGGHKFGVAVHNSSEFVPGGNALKFYSSIRLDVRKISPIKEHEKEIGTSILVKVIKNKFSPPFKEVVLRLIYGKGIM